MYARMLGPLAQSVTLKTNSGTGFTTHPATTAYVSRYRENELISGGSIQLGDLKVIILAENLSGIETMDQGDRIEIDGRNYGVIHWDDYTRRMGSDLVAVEVAVRG